MEMLFRASLILVLIFSSILILSVCKFRAIVHWRYIRDGWLFRSLFHSLSLSTSVYHHRRCCWCWNPWLLNYHFFFNPRNTVDCFPESFISSSHRFPLSKQGTVLHATFLRFSCSVTLFLSSVCESYLLRVPITRYWSDNVNNVNDVHLYLVGKTSAKRQRKSIGERWHEAKQTLRDEMPRRKKWYASIHETPILGHFTIIGTVVNCLHGQGAGQASAVPKRAVVNTTI